MSDFEKNAREIVKLIKSNWDNSLRHQTAEFIEAGTLRIVQGLKRRHDHLLAIMRVADEMRPYMNQFKGAAVDELKARYDSLRGREILK